ncbi:MAG TPA: pyruvoyl-dependent arginine decarboxylase, partial [Thermoplasmatales archaeon]|nr:pyruvoyl-dependent arginine decarboxylase [Thermoplasmatales archaeon]
GIQHCNLVGVSSIVPPNCEIISAEEGIKLLKPGQITFVVLAQNATNEANRLIAASVGLALPRDRSFYGYLSEYHSFGESAKKAGDYAEDLAATMLATTLGIEFDADKAWNEKKQVFEMSGKIVKTTNITQTARGKEGVWTTVIAAAVFIME